MPVSEAQRGLCHPLLKVTGTNCFENNFCSSLINTIFLQLDQNGRSEGSDAQPKCVAVQGKRLVSPERSKVARGRWLLRPEALDVPAGARDKSFGAPWTRGRTFCLSSRSVFRTLEKTQTEFVIVHPQVQPSCTALILSGSVF